MDAEAKDKDQLKRIILDLYYKKNVKMEEIARRVEVTSYYVKKIIDPEAIEGWNIRKGKKKRIGSREDDPIYDPNRDGKLFHNSLTAFMCGDPLPGRSALDERMKRNS